MLLVALTSIEAQAKDVTVLACNAAIVHTFAGKITGVSERIPGALITDNGSAFYALVGNRVLKSPQLSKRKGIQYGAGSDSHIFIKKDAVYSVSTTDTSIIFDQCSEVG